MNKVLGILSSLPMKHKLYSSTTKLEALTELEKSSTHEDVVKKYRIDSSMLTKWQNKLPKIKKQVSEGYGHFLKACAPVYPELDACMLSWVTQMRNGGAPLTEDSYIIKATDFAEKLKIDGSRASHGWVEGFKLRHQFSSKVSFSSGFFSH